MKRRERAMLFTAAAVIAVGSLREIVRISYSRGRNEPTKAARISAAAGQPATDGLLSETEIRDRDIVFYERRAAEDTASAGDRSQLASLYIQRARATGAFTDYERAERLARRSLALRTEHNSQTFGILAGALLADTHLPKHWRSLDAPIL